MQKTVDIIGGGLSGLVVGYELSKKGIKVNVLEKSGKPGGQIEATKIKDYFIENYYHHFFQGDWDFIRLVEEMGLKDNMVWRYAPSGFYTNGRLYKFSTPQDLLRYSPLNLKNKLKLIRMLLKIRSEKDILKHDNITAKEWILKSGNKELLDKFFRPLLRSKWGDNWDRVSAAWLFARIGLRSKRNLFGEKLGYIRHGWQQLTNKLVKNIIKNGGKIEVNWRKQPKGGVIVDTRDKEGFKFSGAMCVVLGLKRKLSDFYWINIIDNSSFGAIIEHTNFMPFEDYGEHIVYLASYPTSTSLVWEMQPQQVFDKYFKDLRIVFPHIRRSDVNWYRVFKEKESSFIPLVGMMTKINRLKLKKGNGRFRVGTLTAFPEAYSNIIVRNAKKCAKEVLDEISAA